MADAIRAGKLRLLDQDPSVSMVLLVEFFLHKPKEIVDRAAAISAFKRLAPLAHSSACYTAFKTVVQHPELHQYLRDPLVEMVVRHAGDIPDVAEMFLRYALSDSWEATQLRTFAVRGLGNIKDERAVPNLVQALQVGGTVKEGAIESLEKWFERNPELVVRCIVARFNAGLASAAYDIDYIPDGESEIPPSIGSCIHIADCVASFHMGRGMHSGGKKVLSSAQVQTAMVQYLDRNRGTCRGVWGSRESAFLSLATYAELRDEEVESALDAVTWLEEGDDYESRANVIRGDAAVAALCKSATRFSTEVLRVVGKLDTAEGTIASRDHQAETTERIAPAISFSGRRLTAQAELSRRGFANG